MLNLGDLKCMKNQFIHFKSPQFSIGGMRVSVRWWDVDSRVTDCKERSVGLLRMYIHTYIYQRVTESLLRYQHVFNLYVNCMRQPASFAN